MDNKTKCIIGIIIVFIIIALIFFWPSAPSAKPTHMVCDSHEQMKTEPADTSR